MTGCCHRRWHVGLLLQLDQVIWFPVRSILGKQFSTLRLEASFLMACMGKKEKSTLVGCANKSLFFLEFRSIPRSTSDEMWYHHLLAFFTTFGLVGHDYLALKGLPGGSISSFLQMVNARRMAGGVETLSHLFTNARIFGWGHGWRDMTSSSRCSSVYVF